MSKLHELEERADNLEKKMKAITDKGGSSQKWMELYRVYDIIRNIKIPALKSRMNPVRFDDYNPTYTVPRNV